MALPILHPMDLQPTNSLTTRRLSETDSVPRKDSIFDLVELLLRQNEESASLGRNAEDLSDVANAGENLQVAGAEAFSRFERQMNNLDKELRNFANAARQLGSSVAILSSAFHLRERLAQMIFLFRQNAADLFPQKILHVTPDVVGDEPPAEGKRRRRRRQKKTKRKAPPHIMRPIINESLELDIFPQQVEAFASDIVVFLDCLNEFPEFTDEAVNVSIRSFEGDLKYWASCLKAYTGRFRNHSVQQYIHDLSLEMGEHVDSITSAISMFIEVGVPTIRFSQQHGAANLLNLSTVATLFSAVTATTMQFSYTANHTSLDQTVNLFWFSSMVFSIAAAVNSLLGVTWKQAMYRSPADRVPWWVLVWIKRSPLVFLVMSVSCYSLGLCVFAYTSNQGQLTSTATTVFTTFTSFGLAAVSAWFASERYIFLRHHGKKWLSDVLVEYREMLTIKLPGSSVFKALSHKIKNCSTHIHQVLRQILSGRSFLFRQSDVDPADGVLPTTVPVTLPLAIPAVLPMTRANAVSGTSIPPPSGRRSSLRGLSRSIRSRSPVRMEGDVATTGKQRWQSALRAITVSGAGNWPRTNRDGRAEPLRQGSDSSSEWTSERVDERRRSGVFSCMPHPRITFLRPKLKELEAVHELPVHSGLVRNLQFSPDGKYLATSSWDGTSVLFHVGDPFVSHRILAHPRGFVGQVAWSPTGNYLLTKLPKTIKVWTDDGVCKKTIDRGTNIESVSWLSDGTFISVEGNCVARLDLKGDRLAEYDFGRVKLHDVAVTPDSSRLIGVGTLLESPTGLKPSKARPEKRVIVFNMKINQIENQTPLLNNVRVIKVVRNSRNDTVALISHENQAPPQLWKLQPIKDRETKAVTTRLILRQTYMPITPVDFAGPSYFGGESNELVISAGKAGDIYIWDQESGALLHHIRSLLTHDITCIAWNGAYNTPFMFATGNYDGLVRVWTNQHKGKEREKPCDMDRNISRSPSPFQVQDLSIDSPPPRSHSPQHAENRWDARSQTPRSEDNAASSPRQLMRERILAYASAQRTDATS